MTDIPIIFSAAMVRALLEGRKTMTRRLAYRMKDVGDNHTRVPTFWHKVKTGDRLWVRENFQLITPPPSPEVIYAATVPRPGYHKWRSCIHMPRWASRITLTVKATKIEPLQAIDEAEAKAEGMATPLVAGQGVNGPICTYRTAFVHLWDSLHAWESWLNDPPVVALTFAVHKSNIDTMEEAA